ncbi:hypothetical protein QJS10_CPA07g00933 [Acorus calamus]|uniref:RNase H type-1 domain-containing protein n=1 Tax=Acorus calamus TaxID=4465 RepID=A0AAV9EFW5_ACOCL|nr:hypothetical protein QJS10_CPA07g00933 [Acorus calamus]
MANKSESLMSGNLGNRDFVWASVINIMGANWVRQQSLVAHISWISSIGSSGTEKKGRSFEDEITPLSQSLSLAFEGTWVRPLESWLKVNSDGSKSEDCFAFGALVRNHSGDCLQALTVRVRAASINILELKGLVEGYI